MNLITATRNSPNPEVEPFALEGLWLGRFPQTGHHLFARLQFTIFVVVSREEVSAVFVPKVFDDKWDLLVAFGQDRQPRQRRPHAVLFSDMIASGPKGFFSAQTDFSRIHQIAEKLPTRGHLEWLQTLRWENRWLRRKANSTNRKRGRGKREGWEEEGVL